MNTIQAGFLTPTDVQSKNRALVVKLIEAVYWLLMFEGALRKWFLPFLSKPLFFVRDPFVLLIYYLCWRHKLFNFRQPLLLAGLGLGLLYWVLLVVQVFSDKISIATGIYGWRLYFFYLPFSFIVGSLLTGADLKRITRRTLVLSIPMAAIVFLQFRSPVDSFVNKSIDGALAFSYGSLARASGTFSFTNGHELFCQVIAAMLLATWLLPKPHRPIGSRMLWLVTLATAVNVLLDGNRGVFAEVALVYVFGTIYRLFISRSRLSIRQFTPELICLAAAILYATLLGPAYEAMKGRMTEGSQSDHASRIVGTVLFPYDRIGSTRLIGNGLALGTPGGRRLSADSASTVDDENEIPRLIEEAGVLGIAYIFYRYVLAAWLTVHAFEASKRTQNPLPFVLVSFPAFMLLAGQVTGSGPSNGFAFIFLGLSLAANNMGNPRKAEEAAV